MVGGMEAGRRVAAAALLALGSVVPHNSTLLAARGQIGPVADSGIACPLTVGTATTDPALANDAARAIAAGYAITDCMPDAQLLAAAEARALIPMGAPTAAVPTAAVPTAAVPMAAEGSGIVGTSSGLPAGTTTSGTGALALPATANPTTALPAATSATATSGATSTGPSIGETSSSRGTSSDAGPTTGSSNDGSNNGTSGNGTSDNGTSGNGTSGNGTDNQVLPGTNDGVINGPTSDPTTSDPTTSDPTTNNPTTNSTATAADTLSWGTAASVEDFDGTLSNWSVYDGPGHAGNGRRSPSAVSVSGGILTISGDANGTTGGMAWRLGKAKYGRWEARVKSPVADPAYHAVALLWPDAENGPVGGEVDFMEISDQSRQKADFFLHYGEADHQLHGGKVIDATQWHNWAVEWTPTTITGYVDGVAWFSTTRADALPPGPMHLALQLDWFPGRGSGAVRQSEMQVDWVRYYPVDGSGPATAAADMNTATTAPAAVTTRSTGSTGSTGSTATSSTTAPTNAG